jgi:hypothetical protein
MKKAKELWSKLGDIPINKEDDLSIVENLMYSSYE